MKTLTVIVCLLVLDLAAAAIAQTKESYEANWGYVIPGGGFVALYTTCNSPKD